MVTTTTNIVNALRYTYGVNKVQYLFNQESPTWGLLSKVKRPVGGRGQFLIPVVTQNPGTFKGISEGGALPAAQPMKTAEAAYALQEYTGLYDLSWKLIQDSSSDKFAFQQAIQALDDGLKRRVMRVLNSDLIGNGTGAMAYLPAADNVSPISVSALPRVETGMAVDIIATSDDVTKRLDNVLVTGVDTAARTIKTASNPASTAAGDYFVLAGTTASPTFLHSNGLLGVIDDANPKNGNLGGLNRSTAGNEFWISFVLSNSGTNRPLTEDLLLQLMDGQREKGGGKATCFLTNLAITRRYHEMLAGERYFALSKPGVLEGGIGRSQRQYRYKTNADQSVTGADDSYSTPYEFSGVDWYADPYFDPNVVLSFDVEHFFIGVGENEVPRPISEVFDNIPFFRQTANATFEVAWYYQMQLLTDNPAAGAKLKDVAEA